MMANRVDFAVPETLAADVRRWRTRSLGIGVPALLLCILGAFISPDQFLRSYLWAYMFIIGVTLGSMALLMLQYLTGGALGIVIRRLCEAASRTLPLVAVLFLPVVLGIPRLYEWSHPDAVAADEILKHKSIYLNVPFFLVRAAIYFAGWLLMAYFLNKWSLEEDRTGNRDLHRKLQLISGPGLCFYGFTVTFMAIDWVLSINPHWLSTIFGLLFIAGQGLSALAFLILVVIAFSRYSPFAENVRPRHLHDLGKLSLAFVMVWAYFTFSQFLIIWAGNLPEEITFYVARLRGGWEWIGLALVVFHFALPFGLLLSRDLKRSFGFMSVIGLWIIIMRLVDLFWLVAPDFRRGAFGVSWMDFLAPIGLCGIWLAAFAWQVPRRPLLPVQDPHLEEALYHG